MEVQAVGNKKNEKNNDTKRKDELEGDKDEGEEDWDTAYQAYLEEQEELEQQSSKGDESDQKDEEEKVDDDDQVGSNQKNETNDTKRKDELEGEKDEGEEEGLVPAMYRRSGPHQSGSRMRLSAGTHVGPVVGAGSTSHTGSRIERTVVGAVDTAYEEVDENGPRAACTSFRTKQM